MRLTPETGGLPRLIYQSSVSELTYTGWEKFERFVSSKVFAEAAARDRARGLPETGIKEICTRFCKALPAVGDGAGDDGAHGMETELVALSNPCGELEAGMVPVAVLYQGAARGAAQVDVFARAPTGAVEVTHVLADAAGVARVLVRPGHRYLPDSAMLRKTEGKAMWESLWVSLTFEIPQ